MKAYENRNNGRSGTACGYCRQEDHSITDCPHIKFDHDEWGAYRVPHNSPSTQSNRWFMSDYSYWVKQINKYYPKWVKAQERKKLRAEGKIKGKTGIVRSCGFCGQTGHNRKQCNIMTSFQADLQQANSNFRQAFYDKVVKEMGLGIGALIKVKKRVSYNEYEEVIGIIEHFDLSSLNLFSVNGQLDYDYRGMASIRVMIDGHTQTVRLNRHSGSYHSGNTPLTDNKGRTLFANNHSYWNSAEYVSTVSPSTQPMDESWVSTGAMENEFEWVVKKRSQKWLKERSVHDTVSEWL